MNNNLWATNFSGNFVAGHNDHQSYYANGQLLGDCGGGPAVQALEIPSWLLLAAGIWAVLILIKKR